MARLESFERIGHRGAPRLATENTLPAFLRAFESGPCAIELDVHATADGVVVVHHDACLGRKVHPPAARGRAIASMGWAEVSAVELAAGISAPSLAAVLTATPPDRTVYVEVKGAGIERAVADVIAAGEHQCAVHSFDLDMILRLRDLAPDVPRGLLFDRYPKNVAALMLERGARDVWPDWRLIDQSLVDSVHAERGRVIAWTVNTARAVDSMLALGVDAICTDDLQIFSALPASGDRDR
jgi:glycerophosphoryl diester phosphodiesterase